MARPWRVAWVLLLGAGRALGQDFPDEVALPGSTIATAQGAEGARLNPASLPTTRGRSVRVTHNRLTAGPREDAHESALSFVQPLPLGFALGLGASWTHPDAPGGSTLPRGDYLTLDLGLGYALQRTLSVGVRWRFFASPDAGSTPTGAVDGRGSLDAGVWWRPWNRLGVAAVLRDALGPRDPRVGLDRALVLGVGLRPTGTDLVTFGLDAMVPEAGGTRWRLGARAWVPSFGFLRAEGAYDVNRGAADTWRASLGVEFYLGRHSGALTGTVGSGSTVGFGASAGWDEQRGRGLPFGSLVVKVELDDSPTPRAFGRLLWRLETLRRDPSVRGVLFAPRANLGGLAEAEELREAFQGLRRAGVRVSCHLTDASGGTWYACAGMDRVSVDLVGGVRLSGVRASHFYLGPLLWRLGVRTDFVRIGDWKSAPEQFTLGGSTRPAREQEERLLDDLYVQLTRAVAAMRRMPEPQARETVDAGPFTARAARQRDLVDAVGTLEQAERAARVSAGGARVVDLDDYAPLQPRRWSPGPAVAVLYIDGDIVDGESSDLPGVGLHLVGDRTVVEAVEAAAADPRIGALVVRVDSGGGSATASELMWRALHAAARRKPVVASFGRVAASGGYYVGVAARELYADAATVTGSIGIFYGKADIAQLLQRAEVGVELRRRGAHADLESVFRPYTDDERALLGRAMGELYGTFVARVAAGRRRTPAEIDRVAQGHLWSGARAVDLGLVDHTGGLLAAVRRARELADLPEEHELVELPVAPGGVLRELARTFLDEPSTPGIARALATSELRAPFAWLVSVALQRGGALAMIDWPLALP